MGLSDEGEGEDEERERFVARVARKEGECMSISITRSRMGVGVLRACKGGKGL